MATIDNLDIQIKAQTSKANAELDRLIRKLGAVRTSLYGVSHGYNATARSVARFSRSISGMGTATIRTNANIKSTRTSLNGFSGSLKTAYSATTKLASAFGKLVAAQVPGLGMLTRGTRGVNRLGLSFGNLLRTIIPFYGIRGVFNWIKDSVGYASDLTEIQNVVDVTFGNMKKRIEDFAATSIDSYGMGPLTAKQIASRFQAMGVAMGITNAQATQAGKALGGILSDLFGIRKVAIGSTLLAIPFLCFGDNIMIISLIGVMLFSMTMAITLGILVSVLKNTPGLAFGLTTIGLFLGTAPIFFIKLNMMMNIILIITMSILCAYLLASVLKEEKHGKSI